MRNIIDKNRFIYILTTNTFGNFFPRRNQLYCFHYYTFVSIWYTHYSCHNPAQNEIYPKFWKKSGLSWFWKSFYKETRCSMRVWGRTNGRIYGKAFKRSSKVIINWQNAQYLSLSHKFKSFTRHVLTFVWLQGTELENEVTVVVNC